MTKSQSQSASPVLLNRTEDSAASFPGLKTLAERGGNALRDMLERFGARGAIVVRNEPELVSGSAWGARSKPSAQCRFNALPLKGGFSLEIDANLIMRLVDLFYGGQGNCESFAGAFRAAEDRMIARIGAHWAEVLPSVWREVAAITPEALPLATQSLTKPFGRNTKLILQSFRVGGLGPTPLDVTWAYPVDFLRQIPALSCEEQPEAECSPDPKWHRQMRLAVGEISLPVRTIFARPEIALSRLLVLRPGDIIPLCLPATVPVTVAGCVFAEATVGEAGGRTAIKITRITGGNPRHD
jgi:flagellar motor switch protein FliM